MIKKLLLFSISLIFNSPLFSQEKIPWIEPSPPTPRLLELPEGMDDFGFRYKRSSYEQFGPVDFRYDENGNLFVFDYWNQRVVVFDTQERYLKSIELPKELKKILIKMECGTMFFSVIGKDTIVLGMTNNSHIFINYVTDKYRIIENKPELSQKSLAVTPDSFYFFTKEGVTWASLFEFINNPRSDITETMISDRHIPYILNHRSGKNIVINLKALLIIDSGRIYTSSKVRFEGWNLTENSNVLRNRAQDLDEFLGRDSSNLYFLNINHLVYVVNPQGKIISPLNFRKIVGGVGFFRFTVKPNGNIVAFRAESSITGRHKEGKIVMYEFPRTW